MTHEFQQRALDKAAARSERKARNAANARVARKAKYAAEKKLAPCNRSYLSEVARLKKRSLLKGLEFDLTADWLSAKLSHPCCEATGIEFSQSRKDSFGRTIDRKDSRKGYTMDNCWVVCWIYNRCKLDGTHADVMRMVLALADR